MQRFLICRNVFRNARVGTTDRLQGQEAPVVIYSLTTFSPEHAAARNGISLRSGPTQCREVACSGGSDCRWHLCLLEPECRSPRQMQLANALCRYVDPFSTHDRLRCRSDDSCVIRYQETRFGLLLRHLRTKFNEQGFDAAKRSSPFPVRKSAKSAQSAVQSF
jgi:hypothetical protein